LAARCYVAGTLLTGCYLATSAVAADSGPIFSASEKQAREPYRATVSSHAVLPRGVPAALAPAPAQATQLIYTGSALLPVDRRSLGEAVNERGNAIAANH